MQSKENLTKNQFQLIIQELVFSNLEKLSLSQKEFAQKVWGLITYKWKWQIAFNITYFLIFILDRSFPKVHQFNIALLSSITSRISMPSFITNWMAGGNL